MNRSFTLDYELETEYICAKVEVDVTVVRDGFDHEFGYEDLGYSAEIDNFDITSFVVRDQDDNIVTRSLSEEEEKGLRDLAQAHVDHNCSDWVQEEIDEHMISQYEDQIRDRDRDYCSRFGL